MVRIGFLLSRGALTSVFRSWGGKFGGNGGLSIRNVEKVKEVLRFQKRWYDSSAEDQWLSNRLGLLPDANMCPPEKEKEFAVEDVWHEWPMGFHVNFDRDSDVWKFHEPRKRIYEYCPEIKIILDMRLERERCIQEPELPPPEYVPSIPEEALGANVGRIPMTKEQFNDQFNKGDEESDELKEHIEELKAAMAKLHEGDGGDEDGKEEADSDVSQEIGEPKMADFGNIEDIISDDESPGGAI